MHVATFSCPHCSTPLRVRDRRFVGQSIDCPDCRGTVAIREGTGGQITGVAAEESVSEDVRVASPAFSPNRAGWIVAGAAAIGLIAFLLWPRSDQGANSLDVGRPNSLTGEVSDEATPEVPSPAVEPGASTLQQRLRALHKMLGISDVNTDQFPRGTVPAPDLAADQRFGWLAVLVAAQASDMPQPRWDRPWNHADNDQFVRRQQSQFLNPQVKTIISDSRYPATHVVGVAGVGDDAASLSGDHPRAGIFGNDRKTSLEQIGDGLANTMLVAGVSGRLGSWAAGGHASVRGFSAEPYVNGPDGFGTGQADGMHVLMADGSVRFLSAATSPTIIRRMAAMNDGLPLDPTVSGDPGDPATKPPPVLVVQDESVAPPPEKAAPTADADKPPDDVPAIDAAGIIADIAKPESQPIDVPLADPVIVYDVELALRQRIVEFDQPDPVPVRELLRLVAEMAAVPVKFDELPPASVERLSQPITVSLAETTVGDILRAIVRKANLTFEKRPQGIYVITADDDPSSAVE